MMKMKCKLRRFFNMIEVSLALGVTAVGVLGAVTILPIALKTTNSTTYGAYLSDAANMIFMGLDDFLNEECYAIGYATEHENGVSAERLQDIYKDRREAFSDIFKTNKDGALNLNEGLEISAATSSGVFIGHTKKDNHGLIAFYPESPTKAVNLPDKYTDALPADIGRPLFAARYRIVVTELENDSEFKMDGLRQLVEAQTEQTTIDLLDRNGAVKDTITIPGARVAGTKRYEPTNTEKKLMKRIYVEFSWPYNAAYKSRNKKTFIKEYYMVD